MRKSTRAISLALVGSGLILAGCVGRTPDSDREHPPETGRGAGSSGRRSGYYGGGWRRYGGAAAPRSPAGGHEGTSGGKGVGASPSGGFGASGHAAGGS